MKRLTTRDHAGFSMIELLVTVLIAGIAFAAMVPLFVQAQKKNSDDNMRVMTLQLARDKIEKVRQLDYDSIVQTNLDDETFADGQFGNTYVLKSGSGTTRDLTVTYTVTNKPDGAASGAESYKQVEVSVSWDAPPAPVYPAVLSTVIYKQYAGPQIIGFSLDPDVLDEVEPDVWHITGTPVAMDAYISPDDIGLMIPDGVTDQTKWGYVHFSVSALNGTQIAAGDVREPVIGEPGHYRWTWDNGAVVDGIYVLEVAGYSSSKQQGNSASLFMTVKVVNPPAPTNLVGTPADGQIQLTWDVTPITDFSPDGYYEVEASGDGIMWSVAATSLTSPLYLHSGLTNGTDHYYRVRVFDTDGNPSPYSGTVGPLQPAVQSDTVAPSVPGAFTAAAVADRQNVQLSWTASLDDGAPATGVMGYNVERSPGAGGPWSQILSASLFNQVLYIDTNVGWATTWYYRVQAVDVAGNASGWSNVASATTGARPVHDLTVVNTDSKDSVYVRVQSATTGRFWTTAGVELLLGSTPAEVEIKKNNKQQVWNDLPDDIYNVYGRYTSTITKAAQWMSDPWRVTFP